MARSTSEPLLVWDHLKANLQQQNSGEEERTNAASNTHSRCKETSTPAFTPRILKNTKYSSARVGIDKRNVSDYLYYRGQMMLEKKKVMVEEAVKKRDQKVSPKNALKNSRSEQIFNQKLRDKLALLFKTLDS